MFRYSKMIYPHLARLVTPKIAERRKTKANFTCNLWSIAFAISYLIGGWLMVGQDRLNGMGPTWLHRQTSNWLLAIFHLRYILYWLRLWCDEIFSFFIDYIHRRQDVVALNIFSRKHIMFLYSLSWLPPKHNMVAS